MACWLNAPNSPWKAILIFLVCAGFVCGNLVWILARFAWLRFALLGFGSPRPRAGLLGVIVFLPTRAHHAPACPPRPSRDPRYVPQCRLPFAAEDKRRA